MRHNVYALVPGLYVLKVQGLAMSFGPYGQIPKNVLSMMPRTTVDFHQLNQARGREFYGM